MADHDDEPAAGFGGESWMPSGPRRATYTPPEAHQPVAADPVASAETAPRDTGVARVTGSDLSAMPSPTGPPVVVPELPTAVESSDLPAAPQRRSLDDADLVRTIDEQSRLPGATLGAMEKLEAELQLREDEAREFTQWQSTMADIGTPEAFRSIDAAIQTFTGVINVVPPVPEPVPEPEPEPRIFELVEPAVAGPFDLLSAGPPAASEVFAYAPPPLDDVPVEPSESDSNSGEPQDDVDDTDLAFDEFLTAIPVTASGVVLLPPDVPPTADLAVAATKPALIPVPVVESSGMEPTPLDRRVGRAARMFWLWFATNSSVLSIAFGAALFSLGMSLRQAIVAAFVGVAISFLPLGLGTLAGKWSGQPTMVASRATFGVVGNIVPALLAVVTRVFWGAVLLWLIAVSTARILVGAALNGPFSELQLTVVTMAIGFLVTLAVAVFGYGLFARIQRVLSVVAALLVIGLIAVTWPSVNISRALTVGDGPWILVVTGAVLVFSFVGLVWVSSSGDLARYQRPSSSGAAAMLWGPLGATLPAFILIAYGALLAASGQAIATGLTTAPLDTIARMMPMWYPVPLIAATLLSLLSGVVLSVYSSGFALQAAGLRVHRAWASVIGGVVLFALAVVLSLTVVGSIVPIFRDLATSVAVPVAAWAGIFSADMIIRRRRFDTASLMHRGGVYPAVNWVNLSMLVVVTAVGYGLTTATLGWLGWQGYLFTLMGVPLRSDLAATNIGVIVALGLGLVVTFATAVPTVRKQERERAGAM